MLSGLRRRGKDDNLVKYTGVAVVAKKRLALTNLLSTDLVDPKADSLDKAAEAVGQGIEIQLVSVDVCPDTNALKISDASKLQGWLLGIKPVAEYADYKIKFKVPSDFGEIGAIIVTNKHVNEFFLKSLKLTKPDKNEVVFKTNAWIYPHKKYAKQRVFFSSTKYIPAETPDGLKSLRKQELAETRGDGRGLGMREASSRIYDYDVYNDYGNPDKNDSLHRTVLGGKLHPYPRRNRSGRPMCKKDPNCESRLTSPVEIPYLPSDEVFNRTKNSTFLATFLKGLVHSALPTINGILSCNQSFKSIEEVEKLYKNGLPLHIPSSILSSDILPDFSAQKGALVAVTQFFAAKGSNKSLLVYPKPEVIKQNPTAWLLDEEFGRQTLAGLHPDVIQAVKEYPPKGDTDLTDIHLLPHLEGLTVAQAIEQKKLFTIDYRDIFLDLVAMANADTNFTFRTYAPRAFFFHTEDGRMMPVAIELSQPAPFKDGKTINRVFTPSDSADHLWQLAKVHFSAMDSTHHQVYSHFTSTHAVMEPFIIATRRQISALHPVFPLLVPHFKDTLSINSAARQILIASEGIIEKNFSLGNYAMLAGSKAYAECWRFDRLSPPRDLVHRGMAEPADASYPGGVKLVIEDYPMARDSLDLWDVLYNWALSYLTIVYKGSDEAVRDDPEIQKWWDEIRNEGHADHKDAPWWPKVDSIISLADVIASMAFIAGPFHAAVNFGQWAYGGYPLNRPTATRRMIPEKYSDDYKELQNNPDKFLLSTVPSLFQATNVMTILEMLASHSVDEEYLGSESEFADFNCNPQLKAAFVNFQESVKKVESDINARNTDRSLKNRFGPAQVPYTLLHPTSDSSGLTGKGVPYSVSI